MLLHTVMSLYRYFGDKKVTSWRPKSGKSQNANVRAIMKESVLRIGPDLSFSFYNSAKAILKSIRNQPSRVCVHVLVILTIWGQKLYMVPS